MSKTTEVRKDGVSFLDLLAIVFIALKLGGVIAWSWWAVLAPLWAPWALAFLIVTVALMLAALS